MPASIVRSSVGALLHSATAPSPSTRSMPAEKLGLSPAMTRHRSVSSAVSSSPKFRSSCHMSGFCASAFLALPASAFRCARRGRNGWSRTRSQHVLASRLNTGHCRRPSRRRDKQAAPCVCRAEHRTSARANSQGSTSVSAPSMDRCRPQQVPVLDRLFQALADPGSGWTPPSRCHPLRSSSGR